jgi:agmatinase
VVTDPLERWREHGEKPDYAGLLTFAGAPYTQDPAELAGVDVAVIGAPTDDLGTEVFGVEISHGTIMRRLVEAEHVDPRRYAQVGLRGYWPGKEKFAWQTERGITSLFMHHVRDLGIREVVRLVVDAVGEGPVFLSVDIDVLDPAFAPGTGTPEPGGMTTDELLWAVREVAMRLEVIGADMVEVIPTGVGSADITALAADRIVREILGGITLRKRRLNTGQPDDKEER